MWGSEIPARAPPSRGMLLSEKEHQSACKYVPLSAERQFHALLVSYRFPIAESPVRIVARAKRHNRLHSLTLSYPKVGLSTPSLRSTGVLGAACTVAVERRRPLAAAGEVSRRWEAQQHHCEPTSEVGNLLRSISPSL